MSSSSHDSSDSEPAKVVKDWLQSDSEGENDAAEQFEKSYFEGDRGHLRLQLQKTYGGDDRFKLDENFKVDKSDAKLMPSDMFGAMSKKEKDELFKAKTMKSERKEAQEYRSEDEGIQWDPEIDMKKEKSKMFDVLA